MSKDADVWRQKRVSRPVSIFCSSSQAEMFDVTSNRPCRGAVTAMVEEH
jgi:hypothetical protein